MSPPCLEALICQRRRFYHVATAKTRSQSWEQRGIYCDSCDMWFHKDCVDMGSFTFLAYATTNVSWVCCRCSHPNFEEMYSIRLKLKPQIILTF